MMPVCDRYAFLINGRVFQDLMLVIGHFDEKTAYDYSQLNQFIDVLPPRFIMDQFGRLKTYRE
jgi:hypothetical protein